MLYAFSALRVPIARGTMTKHTGTLRPTWSDRYFTPLLFVFGSISVVLVAMQVTFALPTEIVGVIGNWTAFGRASWAFSVGVIILMSILWLLMLGGIVGFLASQLAFAVRTKKERNQKQQQGSDKACN